ncbi:MAG: hypothetical protein A2161_08490 [Candidatus Schekmanbacteria bacterium RBG_13_48_7]|uniref:Hydrogenase maturation peptidase HycI n=1 Tax=Candidatus Schekmanbacteria bacterium RBG_13_48_7 TaxID=1817878 RepID=A0A1F7RW92_9BACT|nr:MAG: hypothetical protein A2161_08490 [Candidatus Schekmanbacteria bacterium RBG_13_48_7]
MNKNIDTILKKRLAGKVVVVGVGNCDSCDDGAAVYMTEKLKGSNSLKPLVVGDFPEFYLQNIIEENPDVVMFVDSADMGTTPGSAAIIEQDQLPVTWGNTHHPPLSIIMKYVSEQTNADIFLLGIQPENISHGKDISPQVIRTVNLMIAIINKIASAKMR